jgi:hypothetical protein
MVREERAKWRGLSSAHCDGVIWRAGRRQNLWEIEDAQALSAGGGRGSQHARNLSAFGFPAGFVVIKVCLKIWHPMKRHLRFLLLLPAATILPLAGPSARAEDAKAPETAAPAEAPKAGEKKDTPPTELEKKFRATLTNATLNGRWCMVKDGAMQPDKEEKYTISGVTRLWGENWLIHSRIQYGDHDLTLPVPVKVKWAGDTAVITVDNFGIPGGASYSARVMIYDGTYAGTWSGGKVGGLLHGLITQEKPADKTSDTPAAKPADKPADKPVEKAPEK